MLAVISGFTLDSVTRWSYSKMSGGCRNQSGERGFEGGEQRTRFGRVEEIVQVNPLDTQ
jgi:hypothetical protein